MYQLAPQEDEPNAGRGPQPGARTMRRAAGPDAAADSDGGTHVAESAAIAPAAAPPDVIAHVLPWPGVGGTEHGTLRIARATEDAGFRHVMVHRTDAPAVRAFFAEAGYDTVAHSPPWSDEGRCLRRLLRSSVCLARELARRRVALVHCADVEAVFGAALAARLLRLPLVAHVRSRVSSIPRVPRLLLRLVNRFVFVSRATQDTFPCAVPGGRGSVLYDGVPDSARVDAADIRAVRAELGVRPDGTIVGMVGRLDEQKDFPTLVKAASRVIPRHPTVRFVIVGDTSREPRHREHFRLVTELIGSLGIAEHFVFTGFRSDVARLMAAMDVFVLSTNFEGLPLVILEAMSQGKPVVATAVDGVPEIVVDGETGLLFPHRDDAALARHVTTLVSDPDRAARLGAAGREFARSRFGMDRFARETRDLYRAMVRR